MYLTESALLIEKIEEVFAHLHMENHMVGLDGRKIKMMEEEDLGNTMIMVNPKVLFECIIVSSNNAMLLVLMNKLLHLDGQEKSDLKQINPINYIEDCYSMKMEIFSMDGLIKRGIKSKVLLGFSKMMEHTTRTKLNI